jgi:hypothetical protein
VNRNLPSTMLEYRRMRKVLQDRMYELGMTRPRHLVAACRRTGWEIDSSTSHHWVNGETMPKLVDFPKLAAALDWTPAELAAAFWPQ